MTAQTQMIMTEKRTYSVKDQRKRNWAVGYDVWNSLSLRLQQKWRWHWDHHAKNWPWWRTRNASIIWRNVPSKDRLRWLFGIDKTLRDLIFLHYILVIGETRIVTSRRACSIWSWGLAVLDWPTRARVARYEDMIDQSCLHIFRRRSNIWSFIYSLVHFCRANIELIVLFN